MLKRDLATAMMLLIVLGAAATVKAFNPSATPGAARHAVTIPGRVNTAVALPVTVDIVPASDIDGSAAHFVKTGDGNVGSWTGP